MSTTRPSRYDGRGRPRQQRAEEYPSYPKDVVLMVLEELGVELVDGDHDGWRRALCPMHEERDPSFTVLVQEGAWKCRAECGSSPDLAALVHRVTGEPLADARRRLRMAIPRDPETLARLLAGRGGQGQVRHVLPQEPLLYDRTRVPQYMVNRGFDLELLRAWEVGYDQEYHCAVVPVRVGGKLVGLIRRSLRPGGPKYLNTRGLTKGDFLFGLDHVPPGTTEVAVVEGPMDCMWLHQHGIPAVAILGSSMSERQAELLRRRFWRVTLAFDNDRAGAAASVDAAIRLGQLEVTSIKLPEGRKDVQECTPEELALIFTQASNPWYTDLRPGDSPTVN